MSTGPSDFGVVLDAAITDIYRCDRDTAFRSMARLMGFQADAVVEAAYARLSRHRQVSRDEIERRWIRAQAHAPDRVPGLDTIRGAMFAVEADDRQALTALAGEGGGHLLALIIFCVAVIEFGDVAESVVPGNGRLAPR